MRPLQLPHHSAAEGQRRFLLQLLCCTGLCSSGWSQQIEYQAREVMIPMRDGVELYTQIYEPVGAEQPYPILFTRTPYGVEAIPSQIDAASLGPSPAFANSGYAFVHQDVRGQFQSRGQWELLRPMRSDPADERATDESTDAYDTIEWLLATLEGDNGRVGMWGISYDAWETVMAMADAHPALVAVSPQASPGDCFLGDDVHHFGAFRQSYVFFWVAYMAARRGDAEPGLVGPALAADGYTFFLEGGSLLDLQERYFSGRVPEWTALLTHGNADAYWQERNPLKQLASVRPAVLNVAGWFDAEDFRGPIEIYHEVEATSSAGRNQLVVGPWKHGGWSAQTGDGSSLGDLQFGQATGTHFQEQVEWPFFEHHLRGAAKTDLPEALVFETGANVWHELEAWPPTSVEQRELYLRAGGAASFEAPGTREHPTSFDSDPGDPVPYTLASPVVPAPEYMVEDQRYLAERLDVVSFVTQPLEDALVIAGRPEVQLFVATTGTDADWIVKLIDVYPPDSAEVSAATGESLANAQILISADIFRAKYRESFEQPTPLEPDAVTALRFVLPDRFHRFRAGHRVMVQVHSTWFPLYDRNPQVFMDIYSASEEDYEVQEHSISHEPGAASLLRLPVWTE